MKRDDLMNDVYFVAFEFMFRFVDSFFENNSDNEDVSIIYHKFYQIREDLKNG